MRPQPRSSLTVRWRMSMSRRTSSPSLRPGTLFTRNVAMTLPLYGHIAPRPNSATLLNSLPAMESPTQHPASDSPAPLVKRYDVVILGGAFSGASAAVLLRRDRPDLSVLVIERQAAFDAKVGEATTEMSGMFLTRRLALWQHLEREHLPKEGLRYWFTNDRVAGHAQASESGPGYRSTVPSFQLRRDVLDEHLLSTAVAEGAELARPARVRDVTLGAFDHRVEYEGEAGVETVACRWVLDATGRAAWLGRRLGLIERNHEHPTAAVWCRWEGVRHIDDLAARGPL